MSRRTVDQVPMGLKPFFLVGAFFMAGLFYLQNFVLHNLCRIQFSGKEILKDHPSHILCLWHEDLPPFFIAHLKLKSPHIWLSYPVWYMKPIHIIKKWMGVRELAFGASGLDGKKALKKVLGRLSEGWCTCVTPDGPKGPTKIMKEGVMQMSLKTGRPVIPVHFVLEKEWRAPTWDKKRYPIPFSKITVVYNNAIFVTSDNYTISKQRITRALNGEVSGT